jgi:hypothetical protein
MRFKDKKNIISSYSNEGYNSVYLQKEVFLTVIFMSVLSRLQHAFSSKLRFKISPQGLKSIIVYQWKDFLWKWWLDTGIIKNFPLKFQRIFH